MKTLEQNLQILLDEREIQRLINRFDQTTCQRDAEGFSKLWTEDAVWEISKPIPSKSVGRKAIVAQLGKFFEQLDFFFRTTQSPLIEFHHSGLSATSIAETIEVARMQDDNGYVNVALYKDEFRKVEGTWFFSGRHYEYVWVQVGKPLSGQSLTRNRD